MNKRTKKLTFSAMLVALSIVILYISVIIPAGKLSLVAVAGILPAAVVIGYGISGGILCYAATSVLALILLPDKAIAIVYVLVFGHYPVIKSLIERLNNIAAEWVIKILFFNAVFSALYWGFFSAFTSVINFAAVSLPIVYAAGNAVFIIFDIGFTKLIVFYSRLITKHFYKK
jgi:hypothetical protein